MNKIKVTNENDLLKVEFLSNLYDDNPFTHNNYIKFGEIKNKQIEFIDNLFHELIIKHHLLNEEIKLSDYEIGPCILETLFQSLIILFTELDIDNETLCIQVINWSGSNLKVNNETECNELIDLT